MRVWWIVAGWTALLATFGIATYLWNRRQTPKCPVHGKRMDVVGESGLVDEYACQARDCRWCADVDSKGNVQIFEV